MSTQIILNMRPCIAATLFALTLFALILFALTFASAADLNVSDFGAVADGKTDDGPAIAAAFKAANLDDGPSRVVFEKKTYRLGNNPSAWHYFQMEDHEDLVIDGNGATLLCSEGNLAFFFDGGRDITIRDLTFDTIEPAFTQGEVVAVDASGTIDVTIMQGYPDPPDESFLVANKYSAYGGGGRHMIVFEAGGQTRNRQLGNDHLKMHNITQVSPGVFRFYVKQDYLRHFSGVCVGNWVSYGFNNVKLPAEVAQAKNKSACFYAQIAANRVENISLERINLLGSINGGIRLSDMHGDVTLREIHIIRKPGTQNLLSVVSDALHLMNIRGRVILEDCIVESPGDDCLNLGAQRENLIRVDASDNRDIVLRTTDNRYYYYTIREGDRLQFLDTQSKTVLGVRTVTAAVYHAKNRMHTVTLDQDIQIHAPEQTQVMNLDQNTASTLIRNNTMIPYMRHAMLARARNMTIEGNQIDCSHGGVIGLNLSFAGGQDDARLRNVRATGNTFICPDNLGILAMRPYRDESGIHDTRDVKITNNLFEVASANAIQIKGIEGLCLRENRFIKEEHTSYEAPEFIDITDCNQ